MAAALPVIGETLIGALGAGELISGGLIGSIAGSSGIGAGELVAGGAIGGSLSVASFLKWINASKDKDLKKKLIAFLQGKSTSASADAEEARQLLETLINVEQMSGGGVVGSRGGAGGGRDVFGDQGDLTVLRLRQNAERTQRAYLQNIQALPINSLLAKKGRDEIAREMNRTLGRTATLSDRLTNDIMRRVGYMMVSGTYKESDQNSVDALNQYVKKMTGEGLDEYIKRLYEEERTRSKGNKALNARKVSMWIQEILLGALQRADNKIGSALRKTLPPGVVSTNNQDVNTILQNMDQIAQGLAGISSQEPSPPKKKKTKKGTKKSKKKLDKSNDTVSQSIAKLNQDLRDIAAIGNNDTSEARAIAQKMAKESQKLKKEQDKATVEVDNIQIEIEESKSSLSDWSSSTSAGGLGSSSSESEKEIRGLEIMLIELEEEYAQWEKLQNNIRIVRQMVDDAISDVIGNRPNRIAYIAYPSDIPSVSGSDIVDQTEIINIATSAGGALTGASSASQDVGAGNVQDNQDNISAGARSGSSSSEDMPPIPPQMVIENANLIFVQILRTVYADRNYSQGELSSMALTVNRVLTQNNARFIQRINAIWNTIPNMSIRQAIPAIALIIAASNIPDDRLIMAAITYAGTPQRGISGAAANVAAAAAAAAAAATAGASIAGSAITGAVSGAAAGAASTASAAASAATAGASIAGSAIARAASGAAYIGIERADALGNTLVEKFKNLRSRGIEDAKDGELDELIVGAVELLPDPRPGARTIIRRMASEVAGKMSEASAGTVMRLTGEGSLYESVRVGLGSAASDVGAAVSESDILERWRNTWNRIDNDLESGSESGGDVSPRGGVFESGSESGGDVYPIGDLLPRLDEDELEGVVVEIRNLIRTNKIATIGGIIGGLIALAAPFLIDSARTGAVKKPIPGVIKKPKPDDDDEDGNIPTINHPSELNLSDTLELAPVGNMPIEYIRKDQKEAEEEFNLHPEVPLSLQNNEFDWRNNAIVKRSMMEDALRYGGMLYYPLGSPLQTFEEAVESLPHTMNIITRLPQSNTQINNMKLEAKFQPIAEKFINATQPIIMKGEY